MNYTRPEYFTDDAFWTKLRTAKTAGRKALRFALSLYYAALSPETPTWAKAVIVGALGYFILPLDGVPDFLPFIGFGDDLTALGMAAMTVAAYISPVHKQRADETLDRWFGPEVTTIDVQSEANKAV